jgi:hypothetical protein
MPGPGEGRWFRARVGETSISSLPVTGGGELGKGDIAAEGSGSPFHGNTSIGWTSRNEDLQGMGREENDELGRASDEGEKESNEKGEEEPVPLSAWGVLIKAREEEAVEEEIHQRSEDKPEEGSEEVFAPG